MDKRQPTLFDLPAPWETGPAAGDRVATVVFPDAPWGPYDYVVPPELVRVLELGARVLVPLGRRKRPVLGYCIDVHPRSGRPDLPAELKPLDAVLDSPPLLTAELLEVARWIAHYYLCPLGQALEATLPAGVRHQAGTRRVPVAVLREAPPSPAAPAGKLPAKQARLVELLRQSGGEMPLQPLLTQARCSRAPLSQLVRRGIVTIRERRVLPDRSADPAPTPPAPGSAPPPTLTPHQHAAWEQIQAHLEKDQYSTVLVHGVTGSGKTELYIRAIQWVVTRGKQAIVLVPEISLTPQTSQRFVDRLGEVAVLHSHLTPAERHRQWQRLRAGEVPVVVGARSAVFAPVPRLGLIVIDEEHDGSFKQDQSPRYHAREVARFRCQRAGAPLILGSATPSLESWHQASTGEASLARLPQRVHNRPLPPVELIDLRQSVGKTRGIFSRQLHQAIRQTLQEGGQVILLLNRRGFATHVQCPACGHVVRCPLCDLAVTLHRRDQTVRCHHCDWQERAPARCPQCRFEGIRLGGRGTERLEEEVRRRFPDVPLIRMDSDTMRGPLAHEEAFQRFQRREAQILLGTQMIAKGLDFPGVTLVGVVHADGALHLPDFRATERTFQLVTQVAGRAGRGPAGGRVLVQTFNPEHPVMKAAARHDYLGFARGEMEVRRRFGYPPWTSLIRVIVRGNKLEIVQEQAARLARCVQEHLGQIASAAESPAALRVVGPAPAPLTRLRGQYRIHLFVYSPRPGDLGRQVLTNALSQCKLPPTVQLQIDVDPQDLL